MDLVAINGIQSGAHVAVMEYGSAVVVVAALHTDEIRSTP